MIEQNRKRRWDSIWIGILVGLAVPVAAFGILLTLFDFLESVNVIKQGAVSPDFRVRTLFLVGICLNVIPLQIFQKKYLYNAMRGIVFPTLFYVVLWVVRYYDILFS